MTPHYKAAAAYLPTSTESNKDLIIIWSILIYMTINTVLTNKAKGILN